MPIIFWVVPVSGIIAIAFALILARNVLRQPTGTPKMVEVGEIIYQGARAFLRRQYGTISVLSVGVAVIVGALLGFLSGNSGVPGINAFGIAWRTALAFMTGAVCSGLAGLIGMYVAVRSNVRCASASQRSLREAMQVALRGGAVSGFLVVALSLIGVTVIYLAYGGLAHPEFAPQLIVGFGFGASFVALFAQLGGGIYTKAADMGADLVGKLEIGFPEDDPRNAAVIADLVGDNVGDCAGRGADLFESTAAESIGAMILATVIYIATKNVNWVLFPLVVRAFGLLASMAGILSVNPKEGENPMRTLNRGFFVAVGLSVVGLLLTVLVMLHSWWLFGAGMVGILASIAVVYSTQYYTEDRFRPVKTIITASLTGSATNIVAGTAVGFETTLVTAVTIGLALLVSYFLGDQTGIVGGGVFGTAVATMGMLMTCPYILSEDTFGPITDNANGIIQMSGAGDNFRKVTDRLDAVGNTTKALTKGYAMVSAGLAAFLLFHAYLDRVAFLRNQPFGDVNLNRVEVFVGALFAAMLVYLFASLAIQAVGGAAGKIIDEVRRQFAENPRILTHGELPDYARAVDITAKAALRGMIVPGLIPVLGPVIVGMFLKMNRQYDAAMAVAALLMVGTISGILLASYMNNGGGAWDNAKKFIEDGQLIGEDGTVQGKGSPAHAAAVVGDTVGDPLKDTAGPSLHVFVKLLATATLVLAPLFI
ncbi:MAG TPA: sodium-translocating pyrophosphatase [Anaerolineales bacterium]|nr:sodium-translocating pyrophosphatase [Anaerolineales bacterium]